MFHDDRRWFVTKAVSAEDLARKLTEMTWTGCTAFALDEYLWLNDATSPDGAQEYAVLKRRGPRGTPIQIESVTMSWCDYDRVLAHIERTLRGEDDQNDLTREVSPVLETPKEHGRCPLCT